MTKLFVGGLPYSMTNQQLQDLFAEIGEVASATIIFDKFSGQSKGFAFVEMPNDSAAQESIKKLDGFNVDGRDIHVSVARPKEESGNRNGFQGNSGGNSRFQKGSYNNNNSNNNSNRYRR